LELVVPATRKGAGAPFLLNNKIMKTKKNITRCLASQKCLATIYNSVATFIIAILILLTNSCTREWDNPYDESGNNKGKAPIAAFTANVTTITKGEMVTFTNQSTNTPTSWSWNFGDGGSTSAQNPAHIYNTQGTYTVTLTVTNSYGNDTEIKNNYITVIGSAPEAAFTSDKTEITEGETVTFTDQSTNTPISWSWDFGDGGSSTDQNPAHIYNAQGTYTVTLIATNSFGNDTETKTDYIKVELGVSDFTETASNLNLKMVAVTGGTFQMGSNNGYSDEQPIHTVTVNNYYIGKYEVTQEQWQIVMGNNPSNFSGTNLPVEKVSWNNIQTFITKINQLTSKTYRLPTEAEWEFTALGGNNSNGYTYSGSNTIDNVAWYSNNSSSKTHTVGTKQANELGIYDMSGNVWEWCNDWYGSSYYSSSPQNNPQGPSSGSSRVVRGGGWSNGAGGCRSARRGYNFPTGSLNFIGFRLAYSQ